MIAPGALVILAPFALGFIIGPKIFAGFLSGLLVSGVQMTIFASNIRDA